jgi:hypothetical protein
MADKQDHPLYPLVKGWISKIHLAEKFKDISFQKDADLAMKFFKAAQELSDHIWKKGVQLDDDSELPSPQFRMNVAKVAELVQLFGPSLYHRNPTNIVEPKNLDLPLDLLMQLVPPESIQQAQMAAQQQGQQFTPESLFPPDPKEAENKLVAMLLQYALDYIQRENDKKTHSRRAIDEALIKGAGVAWTESVEIYPDGPTRIGSFYDTFDNLLIDPDCEVMEDAQWIARRCLSPLWEVADKYPVSEKYLRKSMGSHESLTALGENKGSPESTDQRKRGQTNDLLEYWQVYSKMGMGHKLARVHGLKELEDFLDEMGDNCLIVVSTHVPFPLNMDPKITRALIEDELDEEDDDTPLEEREDAPDPLTDEEREALKERTFLSCQWPIPFWADGQWPCSVLAFHEVPNNPYPMSHIKPGLGYLEFITWCMSFMVNKIRTTCRSVAGCQKSLEEDIRKQLFNGADFTLLPIESNNIPDGDINKAVHFFQMPDFKQDIWKVLEANFDLFDKATGLTELMYAASGGMRSAQEANLKQGAMQIRPDDMASKVEDWASLLSRKEAMALRWLWTREDVEPMLGQRGAALWENYVLSHDIEKVCREFNYRIEAGSTRKPNKETRVSQINAALQQWLPILGPWALQPGNAPGVNLINAFIRDWGTAMDVETKGYLLPPPPPPPPNPEQQKIEAELQMKREELELKKQEMGAKLESEKQKLGMQLQGQQMKTQADVQSAQAKMQIDAAKAQQELQLNRQKMLGDMQMQEMQLGMKREEMQMNSAAKMQEMSLDAARGRQELQLGAVQGAQQLQHAEAAGEQKLELTKAESAAKLKAQQAAAKAKPKPAAKKKPKGKK